MRFRPPGSLFYNYRDTTTREGPVLIGDGQDQAASFFRSFKKRVADNARTYLRSTKYASGAV